MGFCSFFDAQLQGIPLDTSRCERRETRFSKKFNIKFWRQFAKVSFCVTSRGRSCFPSLAKNRHDIPQGSKARIHGGSAEGQP